MGRRIGYGLLGAAAGLLLFEPVFFLIKHRFPNVEGTILFAMNFFNIGTWIAQRIGKLPSYDEMNRPITLFPRD